MKAIVAVVLGLAAFAAAKVEDSELGSMNVTQKQMFILKLLNRVLEPVMYKDIEDIGKSFKFEENKDCYLKTDVVKSFVNMVEIGLLPRGEIFTLYVDRQLKEAVTMFHMLYYAKDFATFIKTACWMRMYVNEGMFVYALSVACRHRADCKGVTLPPPYEIYPYYFVRGDVIQKAYLLKMKNGLLDNKLCDFYGIKKSENNVYIIDENVYDKRTYLNDEDRLRYFTEDVDLNTYYYYFHVDYPFWMKDQMYGKQQIRGYEQTLYMYQQLLARYYLERLSVGLGKIPELSLYKPVKTGYWPWLMLHNGVQIPMRPNNLVPIEENDIDVARLVEEYEMIIKVAIVKGYVEINGMRLELNKPEDIEVLGKLIFGAVEKVDVDVKCVDAYRYLLIVLKSVLGLNTLESDKYFVVPTALQSYQTALRDPLFYQLQKRLIDIVYLFKKRLPCYTKEELYFPGVKVNNVVVDKLITYFDYYMMDISNAVVMNEDEVKKASCDMNFWVRKRRLNNQPFNVSIDVVSDKTVDCVVRMFLGPKEDEFGRLLDIDSNRLNFVEVDSFLYKLTSGKNIITRQSSEMNNLITDRIMTRDIMSKLETTSDASFMALMKNYQTGFPTRLLLPKGTTGGMKMWLYVIVSPLKMVENVDLSMFDLKRSDVCTNCRWSALYDKMPLGFPLDREIDVSNFFTTNMKFVDVIVFHKNQVCDMKMRWDRWVLKDYNMMNKTPMQSEYFVDNEVNVKLGGNNYKI